MPAGLKTKILSDGWTAVTKDKSLSAQFEHTLGVTAEGVEIFTLSPKGFDKPPMGTEEISSPRQGTVHFIYGANEASIGGKVSADRIVCIERLLPLRWSVSSHLPC